MWELVICPIWACLPKPDFDSRIKSGTGNHALERQQHVHHLLAVARLLHVGDLAAAAIGDAAACA
jgi:hypothetical protein